MAGQAVQVACLAIGSLSGGVTGGFVAAWLLERKRRRALRRLALQRGGKAGAAVPFAVEGACGQVLTFLEALTRRLAMGATEPLVEVLARMPCGWFDRMRVRAGLDGVVSCEGYAEGRVRLGLMGLAAGAVLGSVFSAELMVLQAVGGLVVGALLPHVAVLRQSQQRALQLERELPEMLEVVSLGLRSGLSFDRSLLLYTQHFDTSFSAACAAAQSSWGLGLTTREAALRDLASTYDSRQFSHVVEAVIRALRFGSSLEQELEQSASEARAVRKSHREELAAKAPVKMMIPTGTLILPAMLLMILGPILLEMMNGF